jgi:putative endonuclease
LFHAVILERSEGSLYSARSSKNLKGVPIGEFTYVYILASGFKKLYIGVTSNLEGRVWQHKNHTSPDSFTARYGIDQLVYFERFASMATAIAREKELKGWLRIKKVTLIIASNPDWKDLSSEWGQRIEPWFESGKSPFPKK